MPKERCDMDKYFNEIEIFNFRGFDYIQIDSLAKLNVFVGANNVGKSSILEAVFMLSGMSNPIIPARINFQRTPSANDMSSMRYLFHNIDFTNRPLLRAKSGTHTRRLTFYPFTPINADPTSDDISVHAGIKQLNFDFDNKEEGTFSHHSSLFTDPSGRLVRTTDSNYQEELSCLFIPADKNDTNATNNFATLVKRNKKQIVIDALREFDPQIESIEALPDGLYLAMKGVRELLPISMAGDGVRRMINIISSIANEEHNIVVIDEFDNGLHYSAHKLMWQVLLRFIESRDIQLFVTTHNLECLQSLKNVLQNDETLQDLANVYNIVKTQQQGFQSYRYSFDELKEAINNEIEIRQ